MYVRILRTVRPLSKKNQVVAPVIPIQASLDDTESLEKFIQDPEIRDLFLSCIAKAGIEPGTTPTRSQIVQVRHFMATARGNSLNSSVAG
ncbi:MAG: hypothetical protein ABIS59_03330 [Candidatus Saccharibacteria bacterium]